MVIVKVKKKFYLDFFEVEVTGCLAILSPKYAKHEKPKCGSLIYFNEP